MAEYLYATGGYTPSAWELKGLACACMTFIILCMLLSLHQACNNQLMIFEVVIFSTKWSLRLSNAVGVVKIITLLL